VVSLTLTGTKAVQVASALHRVPSGSRTHYVRGERGGEICYLLLPTGKIHLLTESGEIAVPPRLQAVLRRDKFEMDA
jgi:hypothetical protein